MKGLFRQAVNVTSRSLDLHLQRQNLVMSNITNVNTPQYKPIRVEFEEQMQKALDLDQTGRMTRTSSGHMPVTFNAGSFKGDGIRAFEPRTVHGENSVDLDKEMVTMAKNTMAYNALTSVITRSFRGMTKIISESSK